MKYRFHGKEKRLSLGVYPEVSLKEARERREAARKLLANDVDPSAVRKAEKAALADGAANSFEVLAREWFAKHVAHWSDSHAKRCSTHCRPDGSPSAHRVLQVCGQVFRYAVATGRAARDPTVDLRGALAPFKGRHFAAVTEPKQLGELLRAIDGYQGSLIVGCALRLAPLVFVRPGELRHAAWDEIDLDAAEWCFTASKTDTEHIVPLARQAVEILAELRPLTGRGRYVFPSARTILDEVLGFRPDFIKHQLAHAVRDVNGRAYNRTAHLPARRRMMQRWADYLDELKSGATIIDIERRA